MENRLSDEAVQSNAKVKADALLDVIQGLIDEIPTTRYELPNLGLGSRLERDLCLDSLARTELIAHSCNEKRL
jgi:hypothetical protein